MSRVYVKLTPEQKAMIVADAGRGLKTAEIIAGMKASDGLDLKPAKVYSIVKKSGVSAKGGGRKKKGKQSAKSVEPSSVAGEILNLVLRLERANEAIFNSLRISLIRKLAEKHQVLVKEEIAIPEGDEITPEEKSIFAEAE